MSIAKAPAPAGRTGLIAITGASGSGKSTIIEALAARGLAVQPEIGRSLIAEQTARGGKATPSRDRVLFRNELFARSIAAYDRRRESDAQRVFFDRTFIEALAYSTLIPTPVPQAMREAARERRFDIRVFVCPPWPDIFTRDAERQHDFAFARRDYEANVSAYRDLGYTLVEVPKAPVEERVAFILSRFA